MAPSTDGDGGGALADARDVRTDGADRDEGREQSNAPKGEAAHEEGVPERGSAPGESSRIGPNGPVSIIVIIISVLYVNAC